MLINNLKLTKDTRFFINNYGIFYEGQILQQYCGVPGNFYYTEDVILEKFIFHKNREGNIYICFRIKNFYNKKKYTLDSKMLGIFYKIKKIY